MLLKLDPALKVAASELRWDELPALPPWGAQVRQPGVASPFVGVHAGALLVAGGANFPDKMPWAGGVKVWWDDIAVLAKRGDGTWAWVREGTFKLPRRLAYGVSVSTPEGVICAGGSDGDRCYADVFMLAWDGVAQTVRLTALPPLPQPLALMAGALVGRTFYLAGGQHEMKGAVPAKVFWSLDLAARGRAGEFKWKEEPSWPGAGRVLPVAAAQRTAAGESFFLFSGRVQQAGRRSEILTDAYVYEPARRAWRVLGKVGGGDGVSVMAGTAAAWGEREVLVMGGDRGALFLKLEAYDLEIEALRRRWAEAGATERGALDEAVGAALQAKRQIYEQHPGFGREVWAYDTVKDTWRVAGEAPDDPQVTTLAVRWDDAVVIPSGEIRPGVRTPAVVRVRPMVR